MKPEDFRQLLIQPGRLVGLIGDYSDSDWSHDEQVQGHITGYLVIERHHALAYPKRPDEVEWDAAACVSLPTSLQSVGNRDNPSTEEEYNGDKLLLLHRHPNIAWANVDPSVHVFGIRQATTLGDGPLPLVAWRPKTLWLSSAAVMTIEDTPVLSEYSRAVHRSLELKKLKALLAGGAITQQDYDAEKTKVALRYP